MIKKYINSKKYSPKFLIGPNGSGKSFIMRSFLNEYEGRSLYISEEGNLDVKMYRSEALPDLKNNIYIIYPKTKYFGEIESREKIKTIEIAEKLIPLLNYCKEEIDYYNSIKNKSKGQEKVSNIFNIIYKNFLNPIDIIFFDEPENFLDDLGLRKITKLFSLIEQSKIKLIIASHNYNLCSLLKVPIDNIIFINKVFDSKKSIYINKMFSLKLKQVKEIFKEETIEFESFIKDKKLDSDSGIYSKLHFYENENLLNMFLKDALNSEQFYRSLFYKKIILFEGATEKRIISKLQSEELQENYYYITFGKPFMLFFCKLFRLIGKDVIVIIDSDKIFKKNSTRYNIAYGITMYLKYKYPNSVVDFEPDLEGYFCIDKQKYSRNGISSNEAKVFASDDFFSSKRNKNKFITYINKR